MHIKPKLGQRLLSMFLSVVMVATSTTIITVTNVVQSDPVFAYAADTLNNNNMVMGPSYVDLTAITNATDNAAAYDLQMMRFSLIKTGELTSTSTGTIVTKDDESEIINNPISICNSSSAVVGIESGIESYRIKQLVNPERNQQASLLSSGTANRLNTRRDYTGGSTSGISLSYSSKWVSDDESDPTCTTGHWETVSDGSEAYFKSSYVTIYRDNSIPEVIGSGGLRGYYQDYPPEGYEYWKDLDNREFFYEYTQAMFVTDESKKYTTDEVPDFILRMVAKMMDFTSPYSDESTFNTVYNFYKEHIATDEYKILCEPMMTFKNNGEGTVVNTLFGSGVRYISMTSCEVSTIDDALSGINYGYTDLEHCKDTENSSSNDFNFFSGSGSGTQEACRELFNSLLLETTEWDCALYSMSDGIETEYNVGYGDQFKRNIGSSEGNFMSSSSYPSHDFGSAFGGYDTTTYSKLNNTANDSISGTSGPIWNSIFYIQIFRDIYGEDEPYSADKARSYSLGDYPDPASMAIFGGQAIIGAKQSTIDIKTSLVGVGEISDTVNSLPVYEDSYSIDSNGDGAVTIKASTELNFEDNATQWNDKVVINVNNGGIAEQVTSSTDPSRYYLSCASTADSGIYRYPHDQGESAVSGQDWYLPAYTKTEITITYAGEDGKALDGFQQVTGSTASAGSSVIADADQPLNSKMFLDNISLLGWHPNAESTDEKAIAHVMSVKNAVDILMDQGISSTYVVDSNTDDSAALSSNNNIDTSSSTASGYITFKAPNYEDIPDEAEYFLVTLKSNIGNVQSRGGFYPIGAVEINGTTAMPSRPQYNEELDSAGDSSGGKFYSIYTDTSSEECNGTVIGSGLEEYYTNNTAQLLVPIVEQEYDVSADSIDINYSTISANRAVSGTPVDIISSLCVETTGSATDKVVEDYGDQKTANAVYLIASTAYTDAADIEFSTKDDVLNVESKISSVISSLGDAYIANLKIGGVSSNSDTDTYSSLRYIGGGDAYDTEDEDDSEVVSLSGSDNTINYWEFCIDSSMDSFRTAINNQITSSTPPNNIYITAVYVINGKVIDGNDTIPPQETDYSNNITINETVIDVTSDPPDTTLNPYTLSCAPAIYNGSGYTTHQLSEPSNYSETSNGNYAANYGMTNYLLSNTGDNFMYGGTVSVDGVSNDVALGKRTTLAYDSEPTIKIPGCSTHASNYYSSVYRGASFPTSWYRTWKSSNTGSIQNVIGGGRVIIPFFYNISSSSSRISVTTGTQQILFKYLDIDTNEKLADGSTNPDYYKFVVKTQIGNYGFVEKERSTCTHGSSPNKKTKTRYTYVTQYVLKDTQDAVNYTIVFDYNYSISTQNSLVYSIDSFLANTQQQGQYSYILEAGSAFGVTQRARLITDIPQDVEVPVYADAYYRDTYPAGAGGTSDTRMNVYYTKKNALQLEDTKIVTLTTGTGGEYNSNRSSSDSSPTTSWTKSDASYGTILKSSDNLEEELFTVKKSGSKYYAYANAISGSKTTNVAKITSGLSIVGTGGTGTVSGLPKLGSNSCVSASSLLGWGIADGLYGKTLAYYQQIVDRLYYNKKYGKDTDNQGYWLHSTYDYDGSTYSPYKHVQSVSSSSRYSYQYKAKFTYVNDFINVRYYRWDAPYASNAQFRGLFVDPDYPDSIKVDQNTGSALIQNGNAISQFIGSGTSAVTDYVDREYGYVGLRVKVICYVPTASLVSADQADPNTSTSIRYIGSVTPYGLFGGTSSRGFNRISSVKINGSEYGTGSIIGQCLDYNLVVIGSTSNRYSSSSSSNE